MNDWNNAGLLRMVGAVRDDPATLAWFYVVLRQTPPHAPADEIAEVRRAIAVLLREHGHEVPPDPPRRSLLGPPGRLPPEEIPDERKASG